jgi:hypothetical protein
VGVHASVIRRARALWSSIKESIAMSAASCCSFLLSFWIREDADVALAGGASESSPERPRRRAVSTSSSDGDGGGGGDGAPDDVAAPVARAHGYGAIAAPLVFAFSDSDASDDAAAFAGGRGQMSFQHRMGESRREQAGVGSAGGEQTARQPPHTIAICQGEGTRNAHFVWGSDHSNR